MTTKFKLQEKVITELKVDLPAKLQREYGMQSSFTAAMDLAQTKVSNFVKLITNKTKL